MLKFQKYRIWSLAAGAGGKNAAQMWSESPHQPDKVSMNARATNFGDVARSL